MMQKLTAIGLILCLAMGGAIGLAEEAPQEDVLEGVLAHMEAADSLTIDAQFAIRQNGEDHITGEALYQKDGDAGYASAAIAHANGKAVDMEMSVSEGTHIVRIGDDYYSMPVDADEWGERNDDEDETDRAAPAGDGYTNAYLSTVIDQLFGAATEKMTISETGISLHLAGDEVPAILNLAVSMMGDMADIDAHTGATPATSTILHGTRGETAQPAAAETRTGLSLGSGLHIDRIDLDIALEGETISGLQLSLVLVGTDADGAVLETELAAVVRITDVNATVPATVDTAGVDMQPMARRHMGR